MMINNDQPQHDFEQYVGKVLDKDITAEEIKTACGAQTIRQLGMMSPMTMDFRPDRVNIIVDDNKVIQRVFMS